VTLDAYELGVIAVQRKAFAQAREQLELAGGDGRALLLLGQLASVGQGEPADPAKARRLYERAAELGNADAAHNLGALYATGRGVAQDYPTALRWYQRAVGLGSVRAHRQVGLMYAAGQGVPVDEDEAQRQWRAAVAGGDTQALHDLGTLFAYHRGDPVQAAHWYLQAAGKGIVAAVNELRLLAAKLPGPARVDHRVRTMLGVIHAFHLDDPATAVTLLTMPARQGDPVAQRTLGYLIQHGMGAEQDQDRAVQLYRAAAEAGDGIAAFNLGMLCGESDEALRWLRRAADTGVSEAYPLLGDKLSQRDLDEQALRWYVRGAHAGHAGSMFAAACWYRDGFGGPVDLVQALRWYLAMLEVGNGDGVHQAHHIVPMMTDDQSTRPDACPVNCCRPTPSYSNAGPNPCDRAHPGGPSAVSVPHPLKGRECSPAADAPGRFSCQVDHGVQRPHVAQPRRGSVGTAPQRFSVPDVLREEPTGNRRAAQPLRQSHPVRLSASSQAIPGKAFGVVYSTACDPRRRRPRCGVVRF